MKSNSPTAQIFLGVAAFVLTACDFAPREVQIVSASISTDRSAGAQVSVQLPTSDMRALAEQEIYSHIVVFECGNETVRYPAFPYLGQAPSDDFGALRRVLATRSTGETVELRGDVLPAFLRRLTQACVKMEGGSYLGSTLASNVVPAGHSHR
jgi:hypothetical protein